MNLSVLQLFGAESTKVIKKQLYTNNMSCKQKKDCSSESAHPFFGHNFCD